MDCSNIKAISEFFERDIQDRIETANTLTSLLARSESRVDNINAMVTNLVETTKHLTDVYAEQVHQMREDIARQARQIDSLLQQLNTSQNNLAVEQKRVNDLLALVRQSMRHTKTDINLSNIGNNR